MRWTRPLPRSPPSARAVLPFRLDVSKAAEVEALGAATLARFGAPSFVFNNAGVGFGGLIWENTLQDWEWVLGVNLMGVVHGMRVFTPMMLEAAAKDPAYEGHIVNTASMAGLVNPPNMGVYNVSKHAVVSLSETLYQDLRLVTEQVHGLGAVPLLRHHRHHAQRAQPAGRSGAAREADEEPADRPGDERQGGGQRQGDGGDGGAVRSSMREQRFYISATRRPDLGADTAGDICRCATRPTPSRTSPDRVPSCAPRCARPNRPRHGKAGTSGDAGRAGTAFIGHRDRTGSAMRGALQSAACPCWRICCECASPRWWWAAARPA